MNVEFSYISLAAKWVRILLNDLSLLDYQKGFQKVNEVFAFLAQSRGIRAARTTPRDARSVSFSSARKNRSLDFHRDLLSTSFRPVFGNDALQLAPYET